MISKRATPALNDRGYSRLKASQPGQPGGEGGTHTTSEKVSEKEKKHMNTQMQPKKYKNAKTQIQPGQPGGEGGTHITEKVSQKQNCKILNTQKQKYNSPKHHKIQNIDRVKRRRESNTYSRQCKLLEFKNT